jgi:hypothetical protein
MTELFGWVTRAPPSWTDDDFSSDDEDAPAVDLNQGIEHTPERLAALRRVISDFPKGTLLNKPIADAIEAIERTLSMSESKRERSTSNCIFDEADGTLVTPTPSTDDLGSRSNEDGLMSEKQGSLEVAFDTCETPVPLVEG